MVKHISEGRKAHLDGLPYSSNPYSVYVTADFNMAMDWAKGWRLANDERTAEMVRGFNDTYTQNANRRDQYEPAGRAAIEGEKT